MGEKTIIVRYVQGNHVIKSSVITRYLMYKGNFAGQIFFTFYIVLILHNKIHVQWNLVITRSDKTKSSYNEVILLVPALYISLFFYPDIMRNLI